MSENTPILKNVKLAQPAQFVGNGRISLQDISIGVWPSPYFLSTYAYFEARFPQSSISIESGTAINNGAVFIAEKGKIQIGKRCLIGASFMVLNSDFHGVNVQHRTNGDHICKDVIIGDDVFIGNDVKVLKGVIIGSGAVIGCGSVVVSDVDSGSIYAGVPAKLIKRIE